MCAAEVVPEGQPNKPWNCGDFHSQAPSSGLRLLMENAENRPTSCHTGAWGPKEPRRSDQLKNLHGALHGMQWIMFVVYWILHYPTSKRWA